MGPIPLTKANEIFNLLAPFMGQPGSIDQFTLERYKRELAKHTLADPVMANQARGMIAVLEWDVDGVHEWYSRALRVIDRPEIHVNYASALQLLGRFREAAAEVEIGVARVPENLTYLSLAVTYTHNAGNLERAVDLIDLYNLRSPGAPHMYTSLMHEALESKRELKLGDDLIASCNEVAFDYLREHRIPFRDTTLRIDNEDASLMYTINVDAPIEIVERLDLELGLLLYDRVPEFNPAAYWIGYEQTSVK